ncbi:MAG: SDR family NAD(P)-dependent oxidoreductase [Chloroflexi bacterium OHK40]
MTTGLASQVALVTGAGAGIGYAIAEVLANAGVAVALNDLRADLAVAAAARINAGLPAPLVTAYPGDVADVVAMRALLERIGAERGGPHICVANAGITRFARFLEAEPAEFDELTAVNLRGSYFTAQAAARAMVAQGIAGRIVLLASVTGLRAIRGLSAYSITRAGTMAMARSLALELGPYGITVNAIAPGATLTERTRAETPNYARDWGALTPTGRASEGADIAAAVRFLVSPEAAQITGQTLVVDGGWSVVGLVPEGY